MKKIYLFLTAVFIFSLTSCFSAFFPITDEEIGGSVIPPVILPTSVVIHNDRNDYNAHPVIVYLNESKSDKNPIRIPAWDFSAPVPIEPHPERYFYFVYLLNIDNSLEIEYELPVAYGRGQTSAEIKAGVENQIVHIPSIRSRMETYGATDLSAPIVTDAYFSVTNDSSESINFQVNGQRIPFYNANAVTNHNAGATNVYKLTQAQLNSITGSTGATGIGIIGMTPTPLSTLETDDFTFQRGYLYKLVYSGINQLAITGVPIVINLENTGVPIIRSKITFHLNGGAGEVPDPINPIAKTRINLPDNSKFDNYEEDGNGNRKYRFGGWNLSPLGNATNYRTDIMFLVPDHDIDLYARWLENIGKPNITNLVSAVSSITLNWERVNNATGYSVYCYKDKDEKELFKKENTTSTSFTMGGLAVNTEYFFRVAAFNNDGEGESSDQKSATTSSPNVMRVGETFNGSTQTSSEQYIEISLTAGTYTISWHDSDNADNSEGFADIAVGLSRQPNNTSSIIAVEDRPGTNMFTYTVTTAGTFYIVVKARDGVYGNYSITVN